MSEITGHLIKMRLGDLDRVKSKDSKEVRFVLAKCNVCRVEVSNKTYNKNINTNNSSIYSILKLNNEFY